MRNIDNWEGKCGTCKYKIICGGCRDGYSLNKTIFSLKIRPTLIQDFNSIRAGYSTKILYSRKLNHSIFESLKI
ncbi:MAG: hypothetical protein RBS85_02760 [Methanofastidiosum sp.]|jgi:hypothetical protein|nr:hypothetical protein [Methanofastidiosum sp.]